MYQTCTQRKLPWSQFCFEAPLYSFPVLIPFKGQQVLQKAERAAEMKLLTLPFLPVAGRWGLGALWHAMTDTCTPRQWSHSGEGVQFLRQTSVDTMSKYSATRLGLSVLVTSLCSSEKRGI